MTMQRVWDAALVSRSCELGCSDPMQRNLRRSSEIRGLIFNRTFESECTIMILFARVIGKPV